MFKRFFFIVLFMSICGFSALTAQVLHAGIVAAGGNASGTGGSVSYSVGQVFYTTVSGANTSVSEGVQQPFEISVFTGLKDITGIDFFYSVYPNPTNGKLILNLDASISLSTRSMSYQLYDVNGKLLKSDQLKEKETNIEMSELNSSTYFLRVIKNKTVIKTFKIIKN